MPPTGNTTRKSKSRASPRPTRRSGPQEDTPSPIDPASTAIARPLESWFPGAIRNLPWRSSARNPYHGLVAEAMLQQTQVSRVVPAFARFIQRFPTTASLAAAPIDEVLSLWSGLGYYRRARNLHAAAVAIVRDHAGVVPSDVATLRGLPGVGRYTAGSIASIVFGQREPIVDGNVRRVLLRIHGRDLDPADKSTDNWAWAQATRLVNAATSPGVLNESMMELGATICVPPPAAPRCDICPIAGECIANRDGLTRQIPRAKKPTKPTDLFCVSLFITDRAGRIMLEQRPATGMWAGLWQLPTIESAAGWPDETTIAAFAAMRNAAITKHSPTAATDDTNSIEFIHQTTHRTVRFRVVRASPIPCSRKATGRAWRSADSLESLGISNAQMKAIALAAK